MDELESASLLFSLLGMVALVGIVVATPVLLTASALPVWARARHQFVDVVGPIAVPLALSVAVTAVAGSLWFSEVVGLQPCTLCWYQRVLIYPQPLVLLGMLVVPAAAGRLRIVSLVLATLAMGVSTYHYLLELYPSIDAGACSTSVPCSFVWFRRFGFLTLPGLAFCTSASITWLVVVAGRWSAVEPERSPSISGDVP